MSFDSDWNPWALEEETELPKPLFVEDCDAENGEFELLGLPPEEEENGEEASLLVVVGKVNGEEDARLDLLYLFVVAVDVDTGEDFDVVVDAENTEVDPPKFELFEFNIA